jgi:cystathionine beta-lyase
MSAGRDWLEQLRQELRVNRDRAAARLRADLPACGYQPGAATYFAWLDLRGAGFGDEPASRILGRSRVALSRGLTFGEQGRGFARLNLATSPANLEVVLDGIVAAA